MDAEMRLEVCVLFLLLLSSPHGCSLPSFTPDTPRRQVAASGRLFSALD